MNMKDKKLFTGIAIGVSAGLLLGGTGVYAANSYANDIKSFSVDYHSLWRGKVSVFDDGGNKCYIASYQADKSPALAMSCVKK